MTLHTDLADNYWDDGFDAFFAGVMPTKFYEIQPEAARRKWYGGWSAAAQYRKALGEMARQR